MAANKGINIGIMSAVGLALAVCLTLPAAAATVETYANGITARIHDADEIRRDPAVAGIDLADLDGNWFPFDRDQVAAALADMGGFETDVTVDVFILPAAPREGGDSYASEDAIYLAPGFGRVAASTVAYITSHEMGHVLTWACLDRDPARWDAYLALRGITAGAFGPELAHALRPREILAEDIRFLFGGRLATVSGTIENGDMALPSEVRGLETLLSGFLSDPVAAPAAARATAFPNPCNPLTTIALTVDDNLILDPAGAVLRVFDLRGSLVSTVRGGQADGNRISLKWTGRSDSGRDLASGRYLYVMEAAGVQARGSVTLVR